MIVPMKKVSVIVQEKDLEASAQSLRGLGLVHLEHSRKDGDHHQIEPLKEEIEYLESAIHIIESYGVKIKNPIHSDRTFDEKAIVDKILKLYDYELVLKDQSVHLEKQHKELEPWGDFNPDMLRALREKGIHVHLYALTKEEYKSLPGELIIHRLNTCENPDCKCKKCKFQRVAIVSYNKEINLPYEAFPIPEKGYKELTHSIEENHKKVHSIKEGIHEAGQFLPQLESKLSDLKHELQYLEALAGSGKAAKLSYFKGFIPKDRVSTIEVTAKNEKWGILVEEPTDNDVVPTSIKNPRWTNIIKPVFDFINIVPGYKEFDISKWFLLFLSGFFGMLIGDAAYGSIFFIGSFCAHLKLRGKVKDSTAFFLMYVLSGAAIIWGLLTGTIFGQVWLKPYFNPILPSLTEERVMMNLCFLIGAIHLTIAHAWRIVVRWPHPKALCDLGWISMVWGAFYLSRLLVIDIPMPFYGKYLFLVGAGLIIFFTNPSFNILKAAGSGLGDFLMNAINSFTDVISYIRLFAVGLATVAIADSFNGLALSLGFNQIATSFGTALILLFGHALNIILAAMAVLVHGIRLNVLEFSSHLGMEWSGVAYNPFGKELKNDKQGE